MSRLVQHHRAIGRNENRATAGSSAQAVRLRWSSSCVPVPPALARQQLTDTFPEPTALFAVVSLIQMWRSLQEKVAAMEAWLSEDTRRRRELIACARSRASARC